MSWAKLPNSVDTANDSLTDNPIFDTALSMVLIWFNIVVPSNPYSSCIALVYSITPSVTSPPISVDISNIVWFISSAIPLISATVLYTFSIISNPWFIVVIIPVTDLSIPLLTSFDMLFVLSSTSLSDFDTFSVFSVAVFDESLNWSILELNDPSVPFDVLKLFIAPCKFV